MSKIIKFMFKPKLFFIDMFIKRRKRNIANLCGNHYFDSFIQVIKQNKRLIEYMETIKKDDFIDMEVFILWIRIGLEVENNKVAYRQIIDIINYFALNESFINQLLEKIDWIIYTEKVEVSYKLALINEIYKISNKNPEKVLLKLVNYYEKIRNIDKSRELYSISKPIFEKRKYNKEYKYIDKYLAKFHIKIEEILMKHYLRDFKMYKLDENNTVFLVASHFEGLKHTHYITSINFAKALVNSGINVILIQTNEYLVSTPFGVYQKTSNISIEDMNSVEDYEYNNSYLKYIYLENISDFKDLLYQFKPQSLLFIGGFHSSTLIRKAFYDYIPIGFVPMSNKNEIDNKIDAIITLVRDGNPFLVKNKNKINQFDIKMFNFISSFDFNDDIKDLNTEIKLDKSKKHILTPINGSRLKEAIEKLSIFDVNRIYNFLIKNENIVWILLGYELNTNIQTANFKKIKKLIDAKKIINLPFTSNFKAILSTVDLVYMPHTFSGGNQSLMQAISIGTPAIASSISDSYGRIPDFAIYKNSKEAIYLMDKIFKNNQFKNYLLTESQKVVKGFSIYDNEANEIRLESIKNLYKLRNKKGK